MKLKPMYKEEGTEGETFFSSNLSQLFFCGPYLFLPLTKPQLSGEKKKTAFKQTGGRQYLQIL